MFDPEAPPRSPAIAAALGPVRAVLAKAGEPGRLLVACSGGPDSIAALGLLTILRRSENLELGVGHVDHGLRPESGAEAEGVEALCRALGLRCFVTRVELERGPGLPARARQARQVALRRQAERFDAEWIVLAHTATDQAETMLMHMARGAGLDGLAAMPTLDRPWLRPVLELTRAQTRELALELDLPFVDDPSNEDTSSLRVRLRKAVLPILRAHNPRVEHAMIGLARQAADADRACERWAAEQLEARRRPAEEAELAWDLTGFDQLPRAVRMRALRRMCASAGVDVSQLRARVVEAMDAAALEVARARARGPGTPSPAPRRFDLRPRRRVTIDKNGVHAHETAPERSSANH
ncbi:MAG: tRNA lysidine(34) synthetase TilS [Enhygromyxa sp.]